MTRTHPSRHTRPLLLAAAVLVAEAIPAAERPVLDCLIEPSTTVEVSTREDGVIASFAVERGDHVEREQVLATLESNVERVALQLARSRASMVSELEAQREREAFAARQLDRANELWKKKAIPHHEVDKAGTELRVAKLNVRSAEEKQRMAAIERDMAQARYDARTITSPIDGVVTERLLAAGESVEDRPIMRLAQVEPLNVEVVVPVDLLDSIRVGMRAQVTPIAPGATSRAATVTIVDEVVDARSGTFGVRLRLPNPPPRIAGGLRCQLEFLRDR